MKFLVIIVMAGIIWFAVRIMAGRFRRQGTAGTPAVLQPARAEIDIIITDKGKEGMPVITVRSNGATLNIQSVKQDSGQYVVSAEKQADNVAVIVIDKKTSS